MLFLLFLLNVSSADLTIPEYCVPDREYIKDTPANSKLSFTSLRQAAGSKANEVLSSVYERTPLEQSILKKYPSFALPYAISNIFSPILSAYVCQTETSDNYASGALNHFFVAGFMAAAIGRDDGCKLIMSHEASPSPVADEDNWMDIKNNLLGNRAGTENRKIFADCMMLLSKVVTLNEKYSTSLKEKRASNSISVFTPENIQTEATFKALLKKINLDISIIPKNELPKNQNACVDLQKHVANNFMKDLTFTSSDECSSKYKIAPSGQFSKDEKKVLEFTNQMEKVAK